MPTDVARQTMAIDQPRNTSEPKIRRTGPTARTVRFRNNNRKRLGKAKVAHNSIGLANAGKVTDAIELGRASLKPLHRQNSAMTQA